VRPLRAVAVGPGIAIIEYLNCSCLASVGPSISTHTDGRSGGSVGLGDGPRPPDLIVMVSCQAGLAQFVAGSAGLAPFIVAIA
jgi:hypothetical protein